MSHALISVERLISMTLLPGVSNLALSSSGAGHTMERVYGNRSLAAGAYTRSR